jgi:penicillin V acylase-like amidase (Ntn superfamily)
VLLGRSVSVLYLPGFAGYQAYDSANAGKTLGPMDVAHWLLTTVASVSEVRQALPTVNGKAAVNEAFRILDNFDIPLGATTAPSEVPLDSIVGSTQWTSAMDTKGLVYYYHTMYNRRVRAIDLKTIPFNKGKVRYLDLDHSKSQDIEHIHVD